MLLGASFEALPLPVQQLHDESPRKVISGEATVQRGRHWLSRLAGVVTALPPAATRVTVRVTIERNGASEHWRREFGDHVMPSTQTIEGGLLLEVLGAVTFRFELSVRDAQTLWRVVSAKVWGIALPARWFKQVNAAEGADGDRYTFDIRASMPVVGLLVHYQGWLDVG